MSSPPGIVQHVGSIEVVQDFESIRKALGYDIIGFLGASYGSFRAAQYTSTFPEHVGYFVLDAIVPHGLDISIQAQNEIAALNRGLLRADAYCQSNASCPFHVEGKGSVPNAYRQIFQTAQKAPLLAKSCTNNTLCYAAVTAFDVQQGMQVLLFNQPDFPVIFEALRAALWGDASAFARGPIPDVAYVWSTPLLCNDFHPSENTFLGFQKSLRAGLELDTNNIGVTQAWQVQLYCSAWPFPTPASRLLNISSPMLLVTADFDTAAPTEFTNFAWETAPKSGLVVRHGDDYVPFTAPGQPSVQLTKDFLRSGALPPPRNESLVSVYAPGMVRGPIADPYQAPTGLVAGDVDSGP